MRRGCGGGEPLGDPLGVAEDALGIGRLVGRDVHESLDSDCLGSLQHVEGAEHVGLHRLGGVTLEERQVLQRCRVKHHLRPAGSRRLLDALAVADVGEDRRRASRGQRAPLIESCTAVQRRLVAVEHHELGGTEAADLAAQLRPDRAACAGDQDPLVRAGSRRWSRCRSRPGAGRGSPRARCHGRR